MSSSVSSEKIDSDWFFNVTDLTVPKKVESLVMLWEEMYPKQVGEFVRDRLDDLVKMAKDAQTDDGAEKKLNDLLNESDEVILDSIVRVLHMHNRLEQLDQDVFKIEKAPTKDSNPTGLPNILDSKLILQSFLDYLRKHGPEKYNEFIHTISLRLVSTVHPNETERNTNLKHYNSIFERFIEWKKDFDSLDTLPVHAPEYRMRRETLNQTRRAIKAEIEGVWQSDQMRRDPIPVESEALRILERYRVIFKAFPVFVKFVKFLVREAFLLYQGAKYFETNKEWREKFLENYGKEKRGTISTLDPAVVDPNNAPHLSRRARLSAIKQTFEDLSLPLQLPRLTKPLISFATWKGGDRDGNPYVVAAFSNRCFVEQKAWVLSEYQSLATQLLDKLTPSTRNICPPPALVKSIQNDRKIFPYIQNVKPHEPYRAKVRYILEKLQNSLKRVNEVLGGAGYTTRPLLSQTLPGPSGYNTESELRADLTLLYEALLTSGGKSQARSLLQDLHILVDTFGLHLTGIDFRQLSEKNSNTVSEYLKASEFSAYANFVTKTESEKLSILIELLLNDSIELQPWLIPHLSSTSRDTLETLLIFSDAASMGGKIQESRAVGKFIISMCTCASDILVVLFLMKLVGMLRTSHGKITECPFDVTGLFETVGDLKAAPKIIKSLLSLPLYKDYLLEHRQGRLTVMMGYSDSVRDGSSLASDAQVLQCALSLTQVQSEINQGVPANRHIQLVFYRGRGDTIPRGYGGSITKALASQWVSTPEEDHTEQNRYLRCYSSSSSTLDHLHKIYSAHISSQLPHPPIDVPRYSQLFLFYGRISHSQWLHLVSPLQGGLGNTYFGVLRKFGILPHLPKSHFASRPVARDGVSYNIDSIRAIPFTMHLAQLREFTTGYYGTGTAFECGIKYLEEKESTLLQLLKLFQDEISDAEEKKFHKSLTDETETEIFPMVIRKVFGLKTSEDVEKLLLKSKNVDRDEMLWKVIKLYESRKDAMVDISEIIHRNMVQEQTPLQALQKMYIEFPPFRYSIDNKETALIIRNKKIIDDYTQGATEEEKKVLENTERESQMAKKWILQITQQKELKSKTLSTNFNSPQLFLLHKIQAKFLRDYMEMQKEGKVKPADLIRKDNQIQMSILAISEALGFAG